MHHHMEPAGGVALEKEGLAGSEQTQTPSPDHLERGSFVQPGKQACLLQNPHQLQLQGRPLVRTILVRSPTSPESLKGAAFHLT